MKGKLFHQLFLISLSFAGLIFSLRTGLVKGEVSFTNNLLPQLAYIGGSALLLLILSNINVRKCFHWQILPSLLIVLLPFLFIDKSVRFYLVINVLVDCLRYVFIGWFIYLAFDENAKEKLKNIFLIIGLVFYWITLAVLSRYAEILLLASFLFCIYFTLPLKSLSKMKRPLIILLVGLLVTVIIGLNIQNKDSYSNSYQRDMSQAIFNNLSAKGVNNYLLTDGLLNDTLINNSTLLVSIEMFGFISFFIILTLISILFVAIIYNLLKARSTDAVVIFFLGLSIVFQSLFHFIINLFNLVWFEMPLPILSGGNRYLISIMFGFSFIFSLLSKFKKEEKY